MNLDNLSHQEAQARYHTTDKGKQAQIRYKQSKRAYPGLSKADAIRAGQLERRRREREESEECDT